MQSDLLQSGISAVVGGVVAALTAWAVVAATRRHERRFALEREARAAALNLFVMLGELHSSLTRTVQDGARLPPLTGRDWTLTALTAEVAMFSLGPKIGARFSQAIGDLRRALEPIEGVENPDRALVRHAVAARRVLTDLLADWLMNGAHRDAASVPTSGQHDEPTPAT